MPWFGQRWIDRILGRRANDPAGRPGGGGPPTEEGDAAGGVSPSDVEEGATAARDETYARHEPFHPPGG